MLLYTTEEVTQLLEQLIPERAEESEMPALLFAIHYAESNGRPEKQQLEQLRTHYRRREFKGILGLCSAIHFGNISGNTFDAFLYRLKGKSIEGGNIIIEFVIFLLCLPFLLPIIPKLRDRSTK